MSDERAKGLLARADRMKADRALFESRWQQIAEVVDPLRADFTTQRTPGDKSMRQVFDGTPGLAHANLGNGLWGMATNAANAWFEFGPEEEALARHYPTQRWMEHATAVARAAFAAGGGRFYANVLPCYLEGTGYGTGVFYIEELASDPGQMMFCTRPLAECYLAEGAGGQVDTVFRRFQWAARAAVQKWGAAAGRKVNEIAEKHPDQRVEFLHAVLPRDDYEPGRLDGRGKPVASVYVSIEDQAVIGEGGYHEFPYPVFRWRKRGDSAYGDGAGDLALPDARMLQRMSETVLAGAQMRVRPPLLAGDEDDFRGMRQTPGSVIYGAIDDQGRQLVRPLDTSADIGLGIELIKERQQAVREAFYFTLLLMAERANMTATEVLARQEEKLRLLGPHLGMVQTELLNPVLDRVFAILWRAGRIAPPPPELLEAGGGLKVRYVSPLARAQKSSEALARVRTLESVAQVAALRPEILDNFDLDDAARGIAEGFAAPMSMLKDPRVRDEERRQRAEQQAAAAAIAAAQPLAAAAEKGAKAAATVQEMAA